MLYKIISILKLKIQKNNNKKQVNPKNENASISIQMEFINNWYRHHRVQHARATKTIRCKRCIYISNQFITCINYPVSIHIWLLLWVEGYLVQYGLIS